MPEIVQSGLDCYRSNGKEYCLHSTTVVMPELNYFDVFSLPVCAFRKISCAFGIAESALFILILQ